jgi:hypothetical protein
MSEHLTEERMRAVLTETGEEVSREEFQHVLSCDECSQSLTAIFKESQTGIQSGPES